MRKKLILRDIFISYLLKNVNQYSQCVLIVKQTLELIKTYFMCRKYKHNISYSPRDICLLYTNNSFTMILLCSLYNFY